MRKNFWREIALENWSDEEWEALCDGCAKCCLIRLEDEETGEIYNTDVHCKLLDENTCRCANYENRKQFVPDCVKLDKANIFTLSWLPKTCAYRLIACSKPLYDWHYLVSGSRQTIIDEGYSIIGKTTNETHVKVKNLVKRIKNWKGE
jgi:uncharacterized protein